MNKKQDILVLTVKSYVYIKSLDLKPNLTALLKATKPKYDKEYIRLSGNFQYSYWTYNGIFEFFEVLNIEFEDE